MGLALKHLDHQLYLELSFSFLNCFSLSSRKFSRLAIDFRRSIDTANDLNMEDLYCYSMELVQVEA